MSHDDSKPIRLSGGIPSAEERSTRLSNTALERYWRIIDRAIGTAIITIDAEGVVTGWSEGARQILGWTEDEMLGRSLGRIFPDDQGGEAALRAEIAQADATGAGGSEGWR
jgi:PAS domain S-box-containing protein